MNIAIFFRRPGFAIIYSIVGENGATAIVSWHQIILPFTAGAQIITVMKRPVNVATLALCLYAVVYSVAAAAASSNKLLPALSNYSLGLIVCAWVLADARERGRKVCYDFDSMMFFFWPIMAPVYLLQTRGLRGFVPMFVFLLIMGAAMAGALVLHP